MQNRGQRTHRTVGWTLLIALPLLLAATVAWGEESADLDSLVVRGDRELSAGRTEAAAELFEQALEIEKKDPRAHHGLAIVGLIRDDPDFAVKHGKEAVKRDKKNSRYHLTLANGYGMKAQRGGLSAMFNGGKYKQECKLAIKYDPNNVEAHMGLLYFYVRAPGIAGGGMDKAEETAAVIAAIDPYQGHMARAIIAEAEEDHDAEEAAYLAAAALDTTRWEPWSRLGGFYLERERNDDAVRVYEHIRTLEPDSVLVEYGLAKSHLFAGDLEAAERGFKVYIASDERPDFPDEASARWRLGQVYEKGGRLDEAKAEWETALSLDPDHEEATESLQALEEEHPDLR